MRPIVALEQRALLRDHLSRPAYQRYAHGFVNDFYDRQTRYHAEVLAQLGEAEAREAEMREQLADLAEQSGESPPPPSPPRDLRARRPLANTTGRTDTGRLFCEREQRRLTMAETYFLARDMIPLVRWAAASLADIDRFDRELWPTDYGFLWLEEPLITTDIVGKEIRMAALTWGRLPADEDNGSGMFVVWYSPDSPTEVTRSAQSERIERELGPLQVTHFSVVPDGMRVGPATRTPSAAASAALLAEGRSPVSEIPNDQRFLLAYLMMLNQTVTVVDRHELDRRAARRFRRMGLPSQVTVVALRRTAHANREPGESLVEWSHRWIVRGHWRNQPYRAADGSVIYRRIWIAPYVKGPDDMPFRQSEKVYALVR